MPSDKNLICFLFILISLTNLNCVSSQASTSLALSVDIDPIYSIASAGDKILIQINLIKLDEQIKKDIILSLSLVDSEGKIISKSTETIALATRASSVSGLYIPKSTNKGVYTIDVEVFDITEENLLGRASKEIIIEKTKITRADVYLMGFCSITIGLFILIIILYKRNKALNKSQKITRQDIEEYLRQIRNQI